MLQFLRRNRQVLCCIGALLLLALVVSLSSAPTALETGSWGLSFGAEGAPPTGNATKDKLAQYDAAFLGAGKTIYLTFDCGYEAGYTPQILDVLKAHHVPAAFFVVGTYIDANPELVCRMADEGHTVGNHTEHHYDMSKISDPDVFCEELNSVARKYRAVTGRELPKYYRPPQGVFSEENLRMAQALGYKTVFWSLAYVDWQRDRQPTAEQAFSKLLPRIHDGAVVLLHATSETNAAILDELLTRWEDMGYTFSPITALL